MKIDLIVPCMREGRNTGKVFHIPHISLALIAGLTPRDVDISITDELVQPIDFNKEVDLVGITVNTKTALRAYQIADEFRTRNIPVVLGGIHPTIASEEAIQHADAVVLGEAENVWTQLLEDFRKRRLKKRYYSNKFPTLENGPLPRRELLLRNKYDTINLIQTSRGCPYACHFCSISSIYGEGVRFRPVDNVISEIEALKGRELLFVDDNFVGRPKYSEQLLTRLNPLKKKWIGQVAVTVADNEELLKIFHKSGCQGLFVGFETNHTENLKGVGKIQNVNNNYFESIKKFHDYGISILGSFILGFDGDDKSCFARLLEFIVKSKIDIVNVGILTPYPGTILYEKMKEENRLIDNRWWLKYNSDEVVYKPKLMTREELYEGWDMTIRELHKFRPILERWIWGLDRRSFSGNNLFWKANMAYRMNANIIPENTNKFSC